MELVGSVPILHDNLHSGGNVMAAWQFKIMLDEVRTVLKSKGLSDSEIANSVMEILDTKLCVGAKALDKYRPLPYNNNVTGN